MKAWRLRKPGGPDAFELEELPRPEPAPGQVLIEIRAFGLNRSEWFTRRGDSPSVKLPRVLGIECVGSVLGAPGGEFAPGQRVATGKSPREPSPHGAPRRRAGRHGRAAV